MIASLVAHVNNLVNLIITVMLLINFYFIVFLLSSPSLAANYFCNFSCGKEHTVCERPNCEAGKECGRHFKPLPFNDEDRTTMLALHNERRNHVASGKETRYGNGKASNMNVLSYSKEMEFVAQCWANKCVNTADTCSSTKKFPGYTGQNRRQLFVSSDSNLTAASLLNNAILYWYTNELSKLNATIVDMLTAETGTTFTQLMWAKTTHVGCGRTAFGNFADTRTILIVCHYGSGHLRDEPVYLRGEPCSDCIICNKQYTSLCGEIEDFTKDTWTVPQEDYSDIPNKNENLVNDNNILHCHYANKDL